VIIQCPFCGAKYEAPPGRRFYVCPYCGTALSEGKTYENVYIFKPTVDKTAAFKAVLNFRPTAAPEDLPAASPVEAELHFLPLYLYYVSFPPLDQLATYATALATSSPPVPLPTGFRFPARWRTPFKPTLERVGVFHSPDLDPEAAFTSLQEVVEEARAYAQVFKVKISVVWRLEGLVYYPIWRLAYDYRGRRYSAAVDATDGTVLYMEYPISARGRAEALGIAAAVAAGAAALGTAVAAYAGLPPALGAVGGGVASLGAAARLVLNLAAARVGKYRAEKRL